MDAKSDLKARLPSRYVTEGPQRAPHRSYYYAMGLTTAQIHQPFVGVATCWNEAAPCNIALMRQAQAVKKGVAAAGGTPREFCTITVTDGIAMGHAGMYASLPSREVIADSVELTMRGHGYDGLVGLTGCDKSLPGLMMAMVRLNVPSVFMYGGSILPGKYKGKNVTVVDVFEGVGDVGDGPEIRVVAGSFTGEHRVEGVVVVVAPLGVDAVATGLRRAHDPRIVEIVLGDEEQVAADHGGQPSHLVGQLFENVVSGRIDDGVDGIQPQPVAVVVTEPRQGVVDEEAACFVAAPVVDYEVSGMNVLRKWFGYRRATRPVTRGEQSALDDLRPNGWPAAYTTDLLQLIEVLTLVTDLECTAEREPPFWSLPH